MTTFHWVAKARTLGPILLPLTQLPVTSSFQGSNAPLSLALSVSYVPTVPHSDQSSLSGLAPDFPNSNPPSKMKLTVGDVAQG